jgi:hypothetical protein
MARPVKLTPEVQARIVEALEMGVPRTVACRFGPVSWSTFKNWMHRGTRPRAPRQFVAFVAAIKGAEQKALLHHIRNIHAAGAKHWQASAWWLERQLPEEFSIDRELLNDLKRFLRDRKLELEKGPRAPPGRGGAPAPE